ncbi:MAG: hypothetical protein ACP5I1_07665, partial [Candidatus Hinthialibacter sp.]
HIGAAAGHHGQIVGEMIHAFVRQMKNVIGSRSFAKRGDKNFEIALIFGLAIENIKDAEMRSSDSDLRLDRSKLERESQSKFQPAAINRRCRG